MLYFVNEFNSNVLFDRFEKGYVYADDILMDDFDVIIAVPGNVHVTGNVRCKKFSVITSGDLMISGDIKAESVYVHGDIYTYNGGLKASSCFANGSIRTDKDIDIERGLASNGVRICSGGSLKAGHIMCKGHVIANGDIVVDGSIQNDGKVRSMKGNISVMNNVASGGPISAYKSVDVLGKIIAGLNSEDDEGVVTCAEFVDGDIINGRVVITHME